MEITRFETEHFFAQYEFTTPHLLCASDCETLTVGELLNMAGVSPDTLGQLPLGYTESQGHPELRVALADAYATASADDIILLATPVEGIYLTARALLDPTDEVIVLTPAYDALINMFEHVVGADRVKKWTFTSTRTGWELDPDHLRALITPQTRLVVVNFPHNPTGYVPPRAQIDELVAIVEEHDLWLFHDEMYRGLIHDGVPVIPTAADLSERAIVLSGLSKTYGLPGLRTGWLVVQDEALRDNLMNWKFYTSICAPAPSEFLAMAAWSVRDQLRARSLKIITENLALADAFFARWPDLFHWRRPMGSSVALVGMNVSSVTEYAARLSAEAGVLILPATALGYDDQHLRMGFGRADFGEALAHFEAYLNEG